MAKRTKDVGETPVAKMAPARRKDVGDPAPRKPQLAVPGRSGGQPEGLKAGAVGADSGSSPSSEEIARRAYEIYLRRGSSNGHELDDWLEAERQLRGSDAR